MKPMPPTKPRSTVYDDTPNSLPEKAHDRPDHKDWLYYLLALITAPVTAFELIIAFAFVVVALSLGWDLFTGFAHWVEDSLS